MLDTQKAPRLQPGTLAWERWTWHNSWHLLSGTATAVATEIFPSLFSGSACDLFRLQRETREVNKIGIFFHYENIASMSQHWQTAVKTMICQLWTIPQICGFILPVNELSPGPRWCLLLCDCGVIICRLSSISDAMYLHIPNVEFLFYIHSLVT